MVDSDSFFYNKKVLAYASDKQICRCAQNRKQKGVDNCLAEIHLLHIGGKESFIKVSKHNHVPRFSLDKIYFMKELKHEAIKDRHNKAPEVVDRLLAEKKNLIGIGT